MANLTADPETFLFTDDGKIPNSKFPLLFYRKILPSTEVNAAWFKDHFAKNNWTNSWDNGVYAYDHYHSNTHEVLGIYAGSALLQLGGENGTRLNVEVGDVIVIPAGVGHKNLESSNDFGVVGAYPEGREWDLLRGDAGERPQSDKNIAAVPIPDFDPVLGTGEGLKNIWYKV